jgi:hypothetical protein
MDKVSTNFCFICLLHLANDRGQIRIQILRATYTSQRVPRTRLCHIKSPGHILKREGHGDNKLLFHLFTMFG